MLLRLHAARTRRTSAAARTALTPARPVRAPRRGLRVGIDRAAGEHRQHRRRDHQLTARRHDRCLRCSSTCPRALGCVNSSSSSRWSSWRSSRVSVRTASSVLPDVHGDGHLVAHVVPVECRPVVGDQAERRIVGDAERFERRCDLRKLGGFRRRQRRGRNRIQHGRHHPRRHDREHDGADQRQASTGQAPRRAPQPALRRACAAGTPSSATASRTRADR